MSHIALIGPGAIGSALLAWLAQSGKHETIACVRTPFDHLEVDTPQGKLTAAPRILTSPNDGSKVDWLLVATKAYDAESAAAWFPKMVGPETRVAVLQNGVEHVERFAPFLERDQIVPVIVDLPAERSAPGRVRQRGRGKLTVADDERGREFAALFSGTPLELVVTKDFLSAAWRKLCINAPGAVSAILLKPSSVANDPLVAESMRAIIREAIAVGRAEGAKLEDEIAEQVVQGYRNAPPDSMNSLHADRAAGRPMEIEARNGVIVRLGRKHRFPTPYNEMTVALLTALEKPRVS
jgi:2-dehydropantoate 2-reductase